MGSDKDRKLFNTWGTSSFPFQFLRFPQTTKIKLNLLEMELLKAAMTMII